MIIFLCGRPGSGKNTVGQQLASVIGMNFWDGDLLYTPEEQARIASGEFDWHDSRVFFNRLKGELAARKGERMCVVAGQGIFLEEYRQELKEAFRDEIFLVHLRVSHEEALERLSGRGKESSHFYTLERYQQEAHEYEEDGTFDLIVDNMGEPQDTVKEIMNALPDFLR